MIFWRRGGKSEHEADGQEVGHVQDGSTEQPLSLWGSGHMLQSHKLAGSEGFKVVHVGGRWGWDRAVG